MKSKRIFAGMIAAVGAVVALTGVLAIDGGAAHAQDVTAAPKHFDPKGSLPSTYTMELRKGVYATLPFADKRDFDEAKKGFIAEPAFMKIMADAGNVAWDMGSYQWLLARQGFPEHPPVAAAAGRAEHGVRPV